MSALDKSSMGQFMSAKGTDAATSNAIAGVVSDVWRAYFGDEWVPFSVRYGIAYEVQRRLAQESADRRATRCIASAPTTSKGSQHEHHRSREQE